MTLRMLAVGTGGWGGDDGCCGSLTRADTTPSTELVDRVDKMMIMWSVTRVKETSRKNRWRELAIFGLFFVFVFFCLCFVYVLF